MLLKPRNPLAPLFLSMFLLSVPTLSLLALESDSLVKARQFFQKGNYDEAREQFEQAAGHPSSAVEARVGLARVLMEQGQYERAEQVSLEALEKSPDHADALTALGDAIKAVGRYEEARSSYERALELNPDHLTARLKLGFLLSEWGERDLARETLSFFISYYRSHPNLSAAELSTIAQACVYLGRVRDANNLFDDATKTEPRLWQAFIPWGNLFLSKYNIPDASGVFEDALEINPKATEALVGLARCFTQSNFEKVKQYAEEALAVNPNLVEAFNLQAEMDIAFGNYEDAHTKLATALKVNPNALSTRTLRAVAFYFSNQEGRFVEEESKILSINPNYSELYFELAENLSRRYLFKESVDYYRRAVELNPEHWSAQAGLGTSLSRLGEETEAKHVLEAAFAKDPYNKYVGNLLTLFDEYPEYKTHATESSLVVRLHEKDDPVLSPYAVALANESFSSLIKKYDFEQNKPVLLEIFPTHDDFAVRCFGLPGAQAFLGICFGNVVAMDSPRARTKGDFVWGETLWHELVHVTHLRMTENRIPRWLAEGLAVYETSKAKPHWSMNLDLPFIQAFLNDQLLPLEELDSGFNRPTSPGQVSLSYFQASVLVEYLVDKYGHPKVVKTFDEFREGRSTAEAMQAVFKKDLKTLDGEFQQYVKEKYHMESVDYSYDPHELGAIAQPNETGVEQQLAKKPNNPFVNYKAGLYYKNNGDLEKAIAVLTKAKELFPNYVTGTNPYNALVEIHLEQGQKEEAVQELIALTARNGKDADALKLLANLCIDLGNQKCAIEALTKTLYISPFDSDLHKKLATAYLAEKRFDKAVEEFQTLLKTEPQDIAGAHCDLANAYLLLGKKSEAKAAALLALELAPSYERAQEILLACIE